MLAVLLVVCGACAGVQGTETTVVVIGTDHFIGDMPEGFTPAHLHALLAKVAPDLLAVEAPANVDDPWTYAPLELWQVTRPWADAQEIACVPVGHNEPRYQQQLTEMVAEIRTRGKAATLVESREHARRRIVKALANL